MRLIPAIDLRGGHCVRLLQGRFDAETVYAIDPAEVLELYRGLGATYLHVVDLDGAFTGEPRNMDVIRDIAARVSCPVQAWIAEFGADRVVLAFDVRLDDGGTPRLTTHGWEQQTGASLWSAVEDHAKHGARHVLCTDVARDGALSGPNFELYAEAVRRFPGIQWQASGGVASGADLRALAHTGVAAVISGRALLEARIPAEELEPFLPSE